MLAARFHPACTLALSLILLSAVAASAGSETGARVTPDVSEPAARPVSAWRRFVSSEGAGWEVSFDESRKLVHRAYGPPIDLRCGPLHGAQRVEEACRAFLRERARFFGARDDELRLTSARRMGRVWYVCFSQFKDSYPILGGRVLMRVSDDGRLFMFGDESFPDVGPVEAPIVAADEARLTAMHAADFDERSDQEIGCRLVLLPVEGSTVISFELCWEVRLRTRVPLGNWYIYVDAHDGSLTSLENRLWSQAVYGTVSGEILPQFYDDSPVVEPFPHESVRIISGDSASTNSRGNYSIGVDSSGAYNLMSRLRGDYVQVLNDDGPDAWYMGSASTGAPHRWTWSFPDHGLKEEMNAYYHINRIHDWIKGSPYGFDQVDYRMNVTVRWGTGANRALYDGRDIYLGEGDSMPMGMRSLALFSDVIYHEYTHAITDRIYTVSGGEQFYAMMEGFSDYVAATLNDDPLLGNGGLYMSRLYDRNLKNDLRYPDNFGFSAHENGQIVGGALWDLRMREGAKLADSLWFYAIHGEPLTFVDFLVEVLVADDDNANISDGTPHDCSIYNAFGRHGIGPGIGIDIVHIPHKDTEETGEPYRICAEVFSSRRVPPTKLYYKGHRDREYQGIWMVRTGNPDEYAGEIPSQPLGTLVEYYFETRCLRLPVGAPDWGVFSFNVGLDTIPPEIKHTVLPDMAAAGFPVEVQGEIVDNTRLSQPPSVEYRVNGGGAKSVDMSRVGDSDVYYGLIDTAVTYGDYLEYRLAARDSSAAGNMSYHPADGSNHGLQVCDGFFDDMESGPGGWVHSSTPGYVDEWRLTDRRHGEIGDSVSWGCGQDSGDYSDLNHSLLETSLINVDFDSRLIFWHRMDAETLDFYQACDGGIVEVSSDSGGTWEHVVPNGGYPFVIVNAGTNPIRRGTRCYSGSFDWEWAEFNLAAYYGDIKIRFRFGSNDAGTAEGWYIDNVQVVNCPPPGVNESARGSGDEIQLDMKFLYPNPARATAMLRYALPAASRVRLEVYNISGQVVRRLADGLEESGRKTLRWDGLDDRGAEVPSGVYFVTLRAGEQKVTRKLEMLR